MQKKYDIDNKFAELGEYSPTPPPSVWAGVEKHLHKEPSKKPLWMFLFGLFFVALLAGAFWHFDNHQSKDLAAEKMADSKSTMDDPQIAQSDLLLNKNKEDGNTMETQAASLMENKNQEKGMTTGQTENSEVGDAPSYRVRSDQEGGIRGFPHEFLEKKGEERLLNTEAIKEQAFIQQQGRVQNEGLSDVESGKLKINLSENHKTSQILVHPPTFLNTSLVLERETAKPFVAQFPRTKTAKRTCFDFSETETVWAVEGFAGGAYGIRTLTPYNGDVAPWKETRLDTEQSRFAWTAGAQATALTRLQIVLRAGVQFTQQNEVFERKDPLFVRSILVNDTNLVTGEITTTTEQEVGFSHVKTYNRLNMLDIPVSIGYEFRKGRKGVSVHASAALNAYFHRRGEMLDENGDRFQFGDNDGYFKNRLGSSVGGSVQFFYTFSPSARIFAEPYVQHIVRPVSASVLQQRYTFGGLKIGISKAIH